MSEQMTCYEDIAECVDRWREILDLKHWQIKIPLEFPCDECAIASIELVRGRELAVLRFAKDFFEEEYEVQDKAILHELIHIITAPTTETGKQMVSHCSQDTQLLFRLAVENEMEKATDKLTEIIYSATEKVKELNEVTCKKGGKKK